MIDSLVFYKGFIFSEQSFKKKKKENIYWELILQL